MKPYYETELGKLYCGNNVDISKLLPGDSIDLTVTSPPYDNLRDYKGYDFDFEGIANELWRITKQGGVVVWVVGDATIDGSETGTSFKQALRFMEIGFNLHDTMIYEKFAPFHDVKTSMRYRPSFEYMFIFVKSKINKFNPIIDVKNSVSGYVNFSGGFRKNDGSIRKTERDNVLVEKHRVRGNIWEYKAGYMKTTNDKIAYQHPATFPEQLVADHIISWSNESDLVFDPFFGSGTVGKICEKLGRRYIGIEISEEYCEIAKKRIEIVANQQNLF